MKLTTPDADTSVRRGRCPRTPWAAALVAVFFALAGISSAWANPLVTPIFNPDGNGNPSCTDVGFDFGFKPQTLCESPPDSGLFEECDANWDDGFDNPYSIAGGEITFLRAEDFPDDNSYVGFESTVPVAGFIVKGGPNAFVYDYEGNDLANVLFDTNLTVPDHPTPGQKPAISHVEVCLNYRLVVEKTAAGTFDRTFEWEIDKSATPESADIFFGDSQEFDYSIGVTNSGFSDGNFEVTGNLIISNPFPGINATNLMVTDVLNDGTTATVDCDGATEVAGGDSIECTYTASPADASATLNTATATYRMAGADRTSTGTAMVGWTANNINSSVTVDDSFDGGDAVVVGSCSVADSPCTFSDSRTLTCSDIDATESGDSGSKSNIATIVETGDSDSATVDLTCWAPSVAKTADPAFTREYFWTVLKALEGDDPPLLSEGQSYTLNYTIDVDLDDPAFADSDFALSGSITVSNPAPIAAVINSVTDVFSGGSNIVVDCDGDAPFIIDGGGSLTCSYTGDSDSTDGTNTATAVQQNYARAADGSTTEAGTTSYSGTEDFAFVTPTNLVNACVDVIDILSVDGTEVDLELLIQAGLDPDDASVCVGDVPVSFSYSFTETWFTDGDSMAEPPICELLVDNTAEVAPFRTDLEGEWEALASSTVLTTLLNANCTPEGCTLTRGYWQTHSAYGPAPYDETWARVGNIGDDGWNALGLTDVCPLDGQCGEDTPFFLSGQSWYQVFWTPPAGGNVYYRLAPQFMAATLNVLNGAGIPAHVQAAWDEAKGLLENCGPNDFSQGRPGRNGTPAGACADQAALAGELASLLDAYNNGYEGVLHCSDVNSYDD